MNSHDILLWLKKRFRVFTALLLPKLGLLKDILTLKKCSVNYADSRINDVLNIGSIIIAKISKCLFNITHPHTHTIVKSITTLIDRLRI